MILLPFLGPKEICQDQLVNKFFYEIAVSRVQTRIIKPIEQYFTYFGDILGGDSLRNCVINYHSNFGAKRIPTPKIEMIGHYSCQMDHKTII